MGPPTGRASSWPDEDLDHPDDFFAELERRNRGEEIVPKAEPEDFGFDEIARDEPEQTAPGSAGTG